jgi:hypothetical protein
MGTIPARDAMAAFEYSGRPLIELEDTTQVYRAVEKMMKRIL